jgi:hypothetical protein
MCFAIFAVIELVFNKWSSLIAQLSVEKQTVILAIYSVTQLALLVIVILALTRPRLLQRKKLYSAVTPRTRQSSLQMATEKKAMHSTANTEEILDNVQRSKIDALLNTDEYPDLNLLTSRDSDPKSTKR